jgi:hypothetical protein
MRARIAACADVGRAAARAGVGYAKSYVAVSWLLVPKLDSVL